MKYLLLITVMIVSSMLYGQEEQLVSPSDLFKSQKCISCHHLESQGFVKKAQRSFDLKNLEIQDSLILKQYLLKTPGFKAVGKSKMMPNHPVQWKGTNEDLDLLIKWIYDNQEKQCH